MLNSKIKHALHVGALLTLISGFILITFLKNNESNEQINPWLRYGYMWTCLLYFVKLLSILTFPQILFNFVGLITYNAFSDQIVLKKHPASFPRICIRVVTRGTYPELVKSTVEQNLKTCTDFGLQDFIIEVVTDKAIKLKPRQNMREVVVPSQYQTKTGALFKARALQYCLEDSINVLDDLDWIVHLDEETLLTQNSLSGIWNFIVDGKHQFGQGLITYSNEVVNWITTLADTCRVAEDMGKIRLQLYMFHKPLFGWKGSYVVAQSGAEKAVSFDNGLDGSVAEDCYFAMRAHTAGYSFNFIEGEMLEKSTFTLLDFIRQRKRWLQGILLVVHSKSVPIDKKILLSIACYSWVMLPLITSNILLTALFPIPTSYLIDLVTSFSVSVGIYMYAFGVVKSFTIYQYGLFKFILFIFGAILTMPFNIIIENIAVIWGLFGNKHKFHIVDKNIKKVNKEKSG